MARKVIEMLTRLLKNDDLTTVLAEVAKDLKDLKGSLSQQIQEKRFNFKSYQHDNEVLTQKVGALNLNFMLMEETSDVLIKEVNQCDSEVLSLTSSLQDINLITNILSWLIDIHQKLKTTEAKLKESKFLESSEIIKCVLTLINDSEDLQHLEMLKSVKDDALLLRERILFDVAEIWAQFVDFKVEKSSKCSLIHVRIGLSQTPKLYEAVKASFFLSDTLIERTFFALLKEHVLLPMIFHRSEVSIESGDGCVELKVTFFNNSSHPHYLDVFKLLTTIMEFTKTYLDIHLADGNTLISKMGQYMAEEVTSTLMRHILIEAIPSNSGELKTYGEIVSNAEKLQTSLQEYGFLPSDYSPFMDHSNDVNLLFANKVYLNYLDRAKDIMRKDLHTVVCCEDLSVPDWELFPPKILKKIIESLNLRDERQLFMAKCQISKSAQDLLNLAITIESEIEAGDDNRSMRLLYTIRNIFEMYAAIVPLHHKKMLETLPQQIAIFHNNCLHFAFQLIIMAARCRQSNILRQHCHILLDQAISMRQLGVRSLEDAVSNQRSQLIYILRDSGLGALSETAKLGPGAEKTVRQCIRQLQLLGNVWTNVLPENVFSNAIGFLVDAFTEEAVSLVIAAEDISSQTAIELVKMFKICQERIPSLFKDPREVHRLCKKWGRFGEMILVLDGNLGSISRRWAEGAGPLACEFTPDQVKHLIRALFQNTEQRAALLVRIK